MSIHINNKELTSAFLGNKNVESMYLGDKLLYTAFIKAQFEVVDNNDNISGIYNYAYNKTDKKWYVKNDQNTYEEYGLIPKVTSLETLHKTTATVVDLNNSWQKSTYWSKAGYDCYESYSNKGVDNSYSTMKVTIPPGMSTFDVIFGSYAESSYDFTLLSALDASKPTSNSSAGAVATSINKQNTQITYTYNITDTSKDHWFWVTYRKNGSNSLGTDRGYLLISSPYTGTSTYKGKLVIYNGDQYMYDGTKWVNKGHIDNWVDPKLYVDDVLVTRIENGNYVKYIYVSNDTNENTHTIKTFKGRVKLVNGGNQHEHTYIYFSEENTTVPVVDSYAILEDNKPYTIKVRTDFSGNISFAPVAHIEMPAEKVNCPTYPLSYEQRPTPKDNLTFTSVSEMKKYPNPYVGMTCTVNGKTYKYSIDGWTYNYIIIGTNTNDQTKNGWLKNNDIKIPLLYGDNPINMKGVYHIYPQYNNITAFNKFNIGTLDSKQLTSCEEMFLRYTGSSLDLSKFDTSNVTNMGSMFRGCGSLKSLDLSKFDTSNVTNMRSMFSGCQSLTSLDLSNFDTSNVATSFYGLYGMHYMFSGCLSLKSLDLSNFDTSKITDMSSMFSDCQSLTSLDLSKFDTSNVTDMSSMFSDCLSLTSLDLSNFDTSNVKSMRAMFNFCDSLKTVKVTNCSEETQQKILSQLPPYNWTLSNGVITR